MMNLKPVKTEGDYRAALKRAKEIFDAKLGSIEGGELEILSLMVNDYENKYYPIDAPDPIEAIKTRLEEMQLKRIELIPEMGGQSRVSEVLNRKRKLTVDVKYTIETNSNSFDSRL